jgi:predicted kinase
MPSYPDKAKVEAAVNQELQRLRTLVVDLTADRDSWREQAERLLNNDAPATLEFVCGASRHGVDCGCTSWEPGNTNAVEQGRNDDAAAAAARPKENTA